MAAQIGGLTAGVTAELVVVPDSAWYCSLGQLRQQPAWQSLVLSTELTELALGRKSDCFHQNYTNLVNCYCYCRCCCCWC